MRRRRRKEETSISSLPLWRRRHKNTRGARRRRRRKGRGGGVALTRSYDATTSDKALFFQGGPIPLCVTPSSSSSSSSWILSPLLFLSPFARIQRQQHTHLVTFPLSPLFLFRLPPAGRGRKRPWRLSRLLPHPSGTQDTLRAAVVLDSVTAERTRGILFRNLPSLTSQQHKSKKKKKKKQQPVRFVEKNPRFHLSILRPLHSENPLLPFPSPRPQRRPPLWDWI